MPDQTHTPPATTVGANATQALAQRMRDAEYQSAVRVKVELRAEDPAGRELQIWRVDEEPEQRIQNGTMVSLWDRNTGEAVQVLRRATNIRSIEKFWVEFILEPYNPFPSFPDPNSHRTMYLAVPIKWAKLHHRTRTIYKLTKAARQLQNTYIIAPAALPQIRQAVTRYWTTRA